MEVKTGFVGEGHKYLGQGNIVIVIIIIIIITILSGL